MLRQVTKSLSARTRLRLGTVLLWLGVLVWVPFIVLRASGDKPSLLWFLPFHLLGVVGGSRLRSSARKDLRIPASKKNFFRTAGHALILSGILVWMPYIYQNAASQTSMDVTTILPFHLSGVLGGTALLAVGSIIKRREE